MSEKANDEQLLDNGGLDNTSSTRSFDDILDLVGGFGFVQKYMTCISWLAVLPEYMMVVSPVFQQYSPRMFCQNDTISTTHSEIREADNICRKCPDNFTFDPNAHSVPNLVTTYNLVCERQIYSTYASTAMLAFKILGALVNGPINNWIGRKRTMNIGLAGFWITGMAAVYTNGLAAFAACRAVSYGFATFSTASIFILLSEIVGKEYRGLYSISLNSALCVGLAMPSPVSYFWPNYKDNQWVMCQVGLVSFLASLFAIESPRLLHDQGNSEKAIDTVLWIAKRNTRDVKRDQIELPELSESQTSRNTYGFMELFGSLHLAVYTAACMLLFLTSNLVSIGLMYNAGSLSLDLRVAHVLNAAVSLIGVLSGMCVMENIKFGRRGGVAFYMGLTAIICTIIALLEGLRQLLGIHYSATIVVSLAFLAQATICGIFPIKYAYVMELFPTALRAHAFGSGCVVGAFANLLVPVVLHVFKHQQWLTYGTFACLSFVATLALRILPKTLGKPMLNTIEEFNNRAGIK